jgi:hypothetical protein
MRSRKHVDEIDGSFVLAYILSYVVIFALIAILVILAAIFIGRRLRDGENARFKRDGNIFTFSYQGNQITAVVDLQPGTYKLQYQFPDGVSVKIDLISIIEDDSETLIIKSGSGSQAFRIEARGKYAFQVDPVDDLSEWSFEISPLGLPSRRDAIP